MQEFVAQTFILILEGHYKVNFPVTLGHEFSGEIVEVGADVKDFKLVTVSLLKLHSMFV